jgi:hypothetical protein
MRLSWWVSLSLGLALFSFLALLYLITQVWPDPNTLLAGPQLLLLLFVFLSLGAGAVPVAAYLNYRFARPGWLKRDKARLLRQGGWLGLFGTLLAYLQLIRALTWTIALVLLAIFILIELFFLTRE